MSLLLLNIVLQRVLDELTVYSRGCMSSLELNIQMQRESNELTIFGNYMFLE
jgi:hypothetical protein